jgi:GNAT superfamily N-acetyltransferase
MNDPLPGHAGGPPGPVTLRPENPEDEAFLFTVYASTRAEELAITGWDEATRTAFLNQQFRAMRLGYRGSFPQADFLVILGGDRPVGRLVVDRSGEAILVVDIALLPEYRNRGIGTLLMRDLLAEAESREKPIRLRVHQGGPAMRFYTRLGFRSIEDYEFDVRMEWRPTRPR